MSQVVANSPQSSIATVREHLSMAIAAAKCHGCGCLASTVKAMDDATKAVPELAPILAAARGIIVAQKYECLGCDICFPTVAANAFQEAYPDALSQAALCPTEAPEERTGWPPLPGDYLVVRYGGSVAVCTLNSEDLAKDLARAAPDGLAIVGTMHTENLGIERLIRNVLANPNIRFLVLCGDDTRQLVGHLPGQSMESLFTNGLDDKQRIVGARGRRPFVKNVGAEHVRVFREQVQLVPIIGERDISKITQAVEELQGRDMPALGGAVSDVAVETVRAKEPQFYKSDPAGFFVVYPHRRAKTLVVEHYTTNGVLGCVVEGTTPTAVYGEVVKRGLVSQLDHAAYLGRELATAERCLQTGQPYVQDRAPGEPMEAPMPAVVSDCGPFMHDLPLGRRSAGRASLLVR